jgi:hypothetical protein
VEINGLPEGARSQPGHHAPGCVTVEPGENGTEGIDPHKPKNLSACSLDALDGACFYSDRMGHGELFKDEMDPFVEMDSID